MCRTASTTADNPADRKGIVIAKDVRTITRAEDESQRQHGNVGTVADLLPITRETWRDNEIDATHWMQSLELEGTCPVPINLET